MVGTVVEARFAGRSHWYPGVIHRVHADSRLDIQYDDGDFETGVKATLVRKIFEEEEEMSGLQRQCVHLEQFIVQHRTAVNTKFVVCTNEHTPQTLVMTLACQLDCMNVLCFGMICVHYHHCRHRHHHNHRPLGGTLTTTPFLHHIH